MFTDQDTDLKKISNLKKLNNKLVDRMMRMKVDDSSNPFSQNVNMKAALKDGV